MSDKKFGHRYQKIFSRIWEDEKFVNLSTSAQLVYLYLQSNRSLSIIGFYVLSFPANKMVCGFKDWETFEKHLNEIIEADMVKFDTGRSLILITNFLKYNPIQSPTQLEGAHKVMVDMPRSKLFHDFLDRLEDPKISELGINSQLIPLVRGILGTVVDGYQTDGVQIGTPDEPGVQWTVEKWNAMCRLVDLPEVFKVTDQRRIVIKKRMEEYSTEKIEEVFGLVSKSAFLLGENDRGWKADFDFVMSKSKFTKILEGSYKGVGERKKKDAMTSSLEAIQRVSEEQYPHNQLGEDEYLEGIIKKNDGEEDGPKDIPPGLTDDSGEF